jgi:preprotein translocase subunit SecD
MKLTWRIWLLIGILILALLAISPSFESGALVKSVNQNSEVFNDGLRAGEIIKTVNGQNILNKDNYASTVEEVFGTNIGNVQKKIDITTNKNSYTFYLNQSPEITVEDVPKTRIKMGLDLQGGARALVQPETTLSNDELDDLIQVSRNRFNVYGLSDVNIKAVSDLVGNKFMLVEVAGATPQDLEQLVAKQGKFEAKVGNASVFVGGIGGEKDIADVCKNDAKCSGITQCGVSGGGYTCKFQFTVYLTEAAAQRHADVTEKIPLDETGQYLKEKLYLYVDGQEVDSLNIGSSLRGQATTQIAIEGPGTGKTQEEALTDAKANMNKLQTILITGSLPYKLTIVKLDTISPNLGAEFIRLILLAGASAIIAVGIIVFARYRKIKASLALLFTSFSEVFIILGFAALVGWNLDLPSIAGILATIGTGVDQQIVILDEARKGKTLSMKERMKKALFIIVSAYFTALVSLLPLYWAGAGLFKGFAFTTIIGITAGVLISRPAFSDMIKNIEEKAE